MVELINKNSGVDIDTPYELSGSQIDCYRDNNFIKLRDVFNTEILQYYRRSIWDKTLALQKNMLPMLERSTYDKAFIQVTNLWCHCEMVKEFVFGKRLAGIACQLMETQGVRLYHDQALFKEAGGGFTPWHADQHYWPLATNKTTTAWVPLQAVPMIMGPLSFAGGSHKITDFRHLEISDSSEGEIGAVLDQMEVNSSPFDIGEVSFHSGWMYHKAPPNTSDKMRGAMTVIYMDKNMVLKMPENQNQVKDWEAFCPGIEVGEICASELNPVLI